MVETSPIHIPFILDFNHFQFDQAVIFLVAVLLSITVNAEAQAMAATVLGDTRQSPKDRFHFNPLLHMSLSGMLCFVIGGFGWPKPINVDHNKLRHKTLDPMIIRMAGPFANLMLAGIAGSIVWIMAKWGLEDQVFSIVVAVNLMVFVFNILPLPPLAGSSVFSFFFSQKIKTGNAAHLFMMTSPYLVVLLILAMRMNGVTILNRYMDPVVISIFKFISSP
ncbi:Zn-dependent protease (includes SpoIVFB) [Desulfocicer vacuolatum DSM 3385]|uniref:Zn-dependent protease (Includes SpoIVFB) n=1 Tax=Desulfocicer vacuolatum DSM 3385 TaxID=1121400 RepID=A0A1W2B9A3_9BACT|nr:site-2 protease family protein [Desulfocicer vacuolatum]SMC69282.1 Zn-dependent protease (includes SpoIVFB) [Desulfocicer vacuolatum DSM 3385]